MADPLRRKIVVIGDSASGKTSLLFTFTSGYFPGEFMPSWWENRLCDIMLDGQKVEIALWDTFGLDEYDRLRALDYNNADGIIIVFSIDYPESLRRVPEKWFPEMKHFCSDPPIPYILLGCKKDLRNPTGVRPSVVYPGVKVMGPEEGEKAAERIGAAAYMECSSLMGEGVDKAFEAITRLSLEVPKRRKSDCIIV